MAKPLRCRIGLHRWMPSYHLVGGDPNVSAVVKRDCLCGAYEEWKLSEHDVVTTFAQSIGRARG